MNLHIRKILSFTCCLLLIFSLAIPAAAESNAEDLIFQMITYYRYYQDNAAMEIDRLTEELAKTDPAKAQAWRNIMDYWSYVDNSLEVTMDVLPDGLPEDDSLCIVVLGYALNSDGSMRSELVGRLKVALASAEKYPNAYILCTGGGTASENQKVTEAKQMARWLRNKGISSDRIITETSSLSTITNARYSCKILTRDYPEVKYLAIVSSHYHVPRGCLLFSAQGQLSALETGEDPLHVVACAGFQAGHNGSTEGMDDVARNLARLAELGHEDAPKPSLSKVVSLEIEGELTMDVGTEPNLTIYALYDTGYKRPVTADCNIFGLDLGTTGIQTLTVLYEERGIVVEETVDIELLPVETEPAETEPAPTVAPAPVAETPADPQDDSPVLTVTVCCLMILGLLIYLYPGRLRRPRRRRKKIILD